MSKPISSAACYLETLFQALAMRYAFVLDKDALQQK